MSYMYRQTLLSAMRRESRTRVASWSTGRACSTGLEMRFSASWSSGRKFSNEPLLVVLPDINAIHAVALIHVV